MSHCNVNFLSHFLFHKGKGKSKTHIALLEIGNAFLNGLCSSIHSHLGKIVCHLVKLSCVMLVVLQHISQECHCLILTVSSLAGAAACAAVLLVSMCMVMTLGSLMGMSMSMAYAVSMCVFMGMLMSVLDQIAFLIFNQMHCNTPFA